MERNRTVAGLNVHKKQYIFVDDAIVSEYYIIYANV